MSVLYRQAEISMPKPEGAESAVRVAWIPQGEWKDTDVIRLYDPVLSKCGKCGKLLMPTTVTCSCGEKR